MRPRSSSAFEILVNVDRPESIHTWKRHLKVDALLRGLGGGSLALTHDSFDTAPAGPAREHLRELLVHHGLVPHRDPDLARFERWLDQRLDSIDVPAIRRPLEQFARWHHLRRIRRRIGQELHGAAHTSKQEITEVGRLLTWLAERDTTIAGCRQADIDEWLSAGPTTRHIIRTFIVWSGEQILTRDLSIGFRQARSNRLITQDDRLDLLQRCLTGEPDTPTPGYPPNSSS